MRDTRGFVGVLAAAVGGTLLAALTVVVLTLAGAFTPQPVADPGPDPDQAPLTRAERIDRALPWQWAGPVGDDVAQVGESALARQRVEMLGHTYVVELVSSPYVEFRGSSVYRAKEGGAFVDFRIEAAGPDKVAAEHALGSATHGNPPITLFVKSAGKKFRLDHRIGAVGDSRGANPMMRVVWPGPFGVPQTKGAEYWITVDGQRHDIAP